jgi:hypothetical protein
LDVRFIVKTSSCVMTRFADVWADAGGVATSTNASNDANFFMMCIA